MIDKKSSVLLAVCIAAMMAKAATAYSLSSSGSTESPPSSIDETLSLLVDVGNDTDYEWSTERNLQWPAEIIVTDAINHYVRGGCWCIGCIHDDETGNCTVPIVLKADRIGNFTVNDVRLIFEKNKIINETGYGDSFRRSEGACWEVDFLTNPAGSYTVPQELLECPKNLQYKLAPLGVNPIQTDDAADDAVWRLFSQMDQHPRDGRLDVPYKDVINVQSESKIGVQTLWGPVKMRLVVWS